MTDPSILQDILGITFADPCLLQQALLHRSYTNENPDLNLFPNERLEFLGDALLNFVVGESLFHQSDNLSEGEMTKLRAALVCQDNLAHLASSLQLGDYLYMGKGEEKSGGNKKPRNLASALEALIGAILVDQGFATARDFTLNLLQVQEMVSEGIAEDYKSRLQEISQAKWRVIPQYPLIEATGPNHLKRFNVEVTIEGKTVGRGCGKSRQSAEKDAARDALEALALE